MTASDSDGEGFCGIIGHVLNDASIGFYGTMAASTATVLGIGAAVVAGRATALAERASVLRVERGDMLNDLKADQTAKNWYLRARDDALADLHHVAARARIAVVRQLCAAGVLVTLCALPLSGAIDDTAWLRLLIIVGFAVATFAWIRFISRLLGSIADQTLAQHQQRERRRAESTEEGDPYIISGDPETLAANGKHLRDLVIAAVRQDANLPRWRKYPRLLRLCWSKKRIRPPRPTL